MDDENGFISSNLFGIRLSVAIAEYEQIPQLGLKFYIFGFLIGFLFNAIYLPFIFIVTVTLLRYVYVYVYAFAAVSVFHVYP